MYPELTGKDDVGVLSAQLEAEFLECASRSSGDDCARRGTAGEGDRMNAAVLQNRLAAARAHAMHDVQHAAGQANLVTDLGEESSSGGSHLAVDK